MKLEGKICRVCLQPNKRFYPNRLVCTVCYTNRTLAYQKANPNREYHAKYTREVYNPKNRHKVMAMNRVRDAIKFKGLKRENCFCGRFGEAHHYLGYEPEHWLDVKWLCRKHHEEAHHAITSR